MRRKYLDWLVLGGCGAIVLAWVFGVPIQGGQGTAITALWVGVLYAMFFVSAN